MVLDSVGVGDAPDAADFGDQGSDTLGNTSRAVGGLALPNLQALGLGNIHDIQGVPSAGQPRAVLGRMAERSAGKDTLTGHWELMGQVRDRAFPTYPDGFPDEVIAQFEERTGRAVIGNRPASGTVIIEELIDEHLDSGALIVYTSADSVFQIAAHKEVVPLEELYRDCRIAREILTGEHEVARVIARPFVGEPGALRRTDERKDFALPPPQPTALDLLQSAGVEVIGVGKIEDIFSGRGLDASHHIHDNADGCEIIMDLLRDRAGGLVFANLNDFDTRFGHRNDPEGYAGALEEFDGYLPQMLDALGERALLVLTADHGTDPTTESTDHSRERVPLLIAGEAVQEGQHLGTRETFADLGATVCDLFGAEAPPGGESFAAELLEAGPAA